MSSDSRRGLRGAIFLSGGSLIGNLIAFLASIILARIYSPAEHGLLAVVSAYAVVITPLVSGRFETAIPIPQRDRDSFRLLMLGFGWSTVTAAVLTALALAASHYEALSGGRFAPAQYSWLAPILAMLTAHLSLMNQFSVRRAHFRLVAARNIVYPSTTAGAQVGLGLIASGAGGLILGSVLGRGMTLLLFVPEWVRSRAALKPDSESPSYRSLLARFSRFPTIFMVSAMINALGLQVPLLLLARWYGDEAAGLFGMSQRTLGVPITLVGAAIGQVYLSELSRAMREHTGEAVRVFIRSSALLFAAGVAIAITLLIAGPGLFSLVFGEPWRISGEIARAMGISFAFQLVASPLAQAFIVYERHWIQFASDTGRLVLVTVAVYAAHRIGLDLVAACWLLSFSTALASIASWLLSKKTVERGRVE